MLILVYFYLHQYFYIAIVKLKVKYYHWELLSTQFFFIGVYNDIMHSYHHSVEWTLSVSLPVCPH